MELIGTFTQLKIDQLAGEGWTFADIAPDNLDIRGPHCRPRQCPTGPRFWGRSAREVGSKRSPRRKKALTRFRQPGPKTSTLLRWSGYHGLRIYGTGLASVFASETVARCALRWQVLYRCAHQSSLLSIDLSCSHREGKKCTLLSQRCRRR